MRHSNKGLRYLLLAALLSPAWTVSAPSAFAARKHSVAAENFECRGVGRGHHQKNMTEADCVKAGGTIERGGKAPVMPMRKASTVTSPRRSGLMPDNKFSCRGIGTGHHRKGMTEADCVRMGGTVEPAR